MVFDSTLPMVLLELRGGGVWGRVDCYRKSRSAVWIPEVGMTDGLGERLTEGGPDGGSQGKSKSNRRLWTPLAGGE